MFEDRLLGSMLEATGGLLLVPWRMISMDFLRVTWSHFLLLRLKVLSGLIDLRSFFQFLSLPGGLLLAERTFLRSV
jgi:hypothetical protein